MSERYTRLGTAYKPVTHEQILATLDDWKSAEEVGEELWPHLHGKGPSRGGPSSCAVSATFQLRKLEHAGRIISDNGRLTRFRRKLESEAS